MLAWIDLEMTGLDLERHVIVEIATLITDDNLDFIYDGPDIVISATDEQLSEMDDVVIKMHSESGLLEAVKQSTTTLEEATAQTLEFLRKHVQEGTKVPLCGNSIGIDRRFLNKYIPELENFFHYRSIDVSTIKELSKRWFPKVYYQTPKKNSSHRALDDIKESVEELKYYKNVLFHPIGH
jgi:oligoribonuclease